MFWTRLCRMMPFANANVCTICANEFHSFCLANAVDLSWSVVQLIGTGISSFFIRKYICVCVFECQDLWCSSHQDSPQALLDSVGASGLWITAVMNHVGDVTKIINKFPKLCLMSDFNSIYYLFRFA